jgi:hypothetical protein
VLIYDKYGQTMKYWIILIILIVGGLPLCLAFWIYIEIMMPPMISTNLIPILTGTILIIEKLRMINLRMRYTLMLIRQVLMNLLNLYQGLIIGLDHILNRGH